MVQLGRPLKSLTMAFALTASLLMAENVRYFSQGLAPLDLANTPDSQQTAATCRSCHQSATHEWEQSRHALSWTNGIFQREFRQQPKAWCVHCHAPLAKRAAGALFPQVDAVAAEGINCAVCHLRDGQMLARYQRSSSPHRTVSDPNFGSPDYCGDCHEFNFPVLSNDGQVQRYSDHPMQATRTQFLAGPFAGAKDGCLGCHGSSPAGHLYPGAHHPDMLRSALQSTICRSGGDKIRLKIKNVGAGHNVPTGDVHRHLVVRLWRPSAPTRLVEEVIGRAFAPAADGGKELVWDTSLPPGESYEKRLRVNRLGGGADESVDFSLTYVFTADEFPIVGRGPGEPTTQVITEWRFKFEDLERCP